MTVKPPAGAGNQGNPAEGPERQVEVTTKDGRKWTVTTRRKGEPGEIERLAEAILARAFKEVGEGVSFKALRASPKFNEKTHLVSEIDIDIEGLDEGSNLHAIMNTTTDRFREVADFFERVMPGTNTPVKAAGASAAPLDVRAKAPAPNTPTPAADRLKELENQKKAEVKRVVDELVGVLKSWWFRRTKRFNAALERAVGELRIIEDEVGEDEYLKDFITPKILKQLIQNEVGKRIEQDDDLMERLQAIKK